MKYLIFFLSIQACMIIESCSQSIIRRLPGYSGDLPFKLETGYVGVGEKEDVQLFYYFIESTRNPTKDPLIFHMPGGPGASVLSGFFYKMAPLDFNLDDGQLTLNPYSWTEMANIIFVDIPVGTGFSYSETPEGWISSDSDLANQAVDFITKFLKDHPKYSRNPLYISGISYTGLIAPVVALELYERNERSTDHATLNIQGYILTSPLTDKFRDFNSRLEYAHRMALVSDNIYKSAIDSCLGNYVDINSANSTCLNSLQSYQECTSRINSENILEPFCDAKDPTLDCDNDVDKAITKWANTEVVQQALNVRQGKIEEWVRINKPLHYSQGKNDTLYYSYDIFSSFSYHKKLSSKSCRALIVSGDHDFTFSYVGVEEWITSLNIKTQVPWKPFYIDGQVGGYETKYAQNDYSLTYATVKGAGHIVPNDKPKQAMVLIQEHFLFYKQFLDEIR